jgi:hypothetical protein
MELMSEIAIDLYSDGSERSKKIEDVLRKYRVPYVKHSEQVFDHEHETERPYLTIGDPMGTPLGPVTDLRSIDIAMRNLVLPGGELTDPRLGRSGNHSKNP